MDPESSDKDQSNSPENKLGVIMDEENAAADGFYS